MPARPTSLAARSSKRPVANQRARIFYYVLTKGPHGATLEEIETGLALPGNTVRPRRVELEKKGYIIDSTRKRPTVRGYDAVVWVVPDAVATKAIERLAEKGAM